MKRKGFSIRATTVAVSGKCIFCLAKFKDNPGQTFCLEGIDKRS